MVHAPPHTPTPPTTDTPALSLAIPLYNEASGVSAVAASLASTLEKAGIAYQLVLVDNGSRDATWPTIQGIARRNPRVDVLHLPRNAGYGGGILAGLELARAPVLGYLWGDEQVGHYAVVTLFRWIEAGKADMGKVRRVVRLEGLRRAALTRVYHAVFPLFFPLPSRDVHGCPKLFTRDAWERLQPSSRDWFLDAEIMIRARELELRIKELDVVAYPRSTGTSHVRWSTVVEFARNLTGYRTRRWLEQAGSRLRQAR